MEKIRVGVVGATGYAGSEICRLIAGHPQAELAAISSVSFEGMALSQVYPAYNQMIDLVCGTQDQVVAQSDVVFAALPHVLSHDLAAQCDALGKTFIDMGADFRLEDEAAYQEWYGGAYQDKALHEKAVYGLPEFFREKIRGKKVIANPGCYTTAVPLALVPPWRPGLSRVTASSPTANPASPARGASPPRATTTPSSTRASPPTRWQPTATPRRLSRPCPRWWAAP